MRILYEDSIPHGYDYFSTLGDASAYSAASLTPEALRDCQYLAVRSTTQVNGQLLAQADQLQHVATATAGTNHLDTAWLEDNQIGWSSAAGCNAQAVAEYVVSILLTAHQQQRLDIRTIRVGIVGAGHVGTALAHLLQALDIAYVLNDPPRQAAGDARHFVDLDTALHCDVISLHIPYITDGPHPTAQLLDASRLQGLNNKQLLINACRGEVIDEAALKTRLQAGDAPTVALDVFLNEPEIDTELLDLVWLATGHIAGHSIEGKLRGTQMVYEQLCGLSGQPQTLALEDFLASPLPIDLTPRSPSMDWLSVEEVCDLLLSIYAVTEDDATFRQAMANGRQFKAFRKNYRVRREFDAYTLHINGVVSEGILRQLTGLGFVIETY